MHILLSKSCTDAFKLSFQDVMLQHYMDYTAESLIPVMAHIAKNVVKVNNGLTKHMVSFLYFKF